MKRIYLVVRTSYDVFVKPTYALLRKERTNILRLIVRSFFVKLAPGRSSHSSDMRIADCQDVGHLNATIKNIFFRSADSYFYKSLPKLKKKKKYAIHGLAQVRIPAKIDVQHD